MATLPFSVEPELKYCLRCQDEYRQEVTHCAECGLALTSGRDLLGKANQQLASRKKRTIDEPMVAVRKGPVQQIKQDQALLAEHGLASVADGSDPSCSKGCCGRAELMLYVHEADLQAVMELFQEDYIRTTGIEALTSTGAVYQGDGAEITCPACGYIFATDEQAKCPDCGLCFM
ncbi:MAG: hypothetical protein CSA34_03830 [Desulfobulbus propionicus]|nr:MAG: hypothetical protein CSA34_03830 [Desulfobulbus propionicus]